MIATGQEEWENLNQNKICIPDQMSHRSTASISAAEEGTEYLVVLWSVRAFQVFIYIYYQRCSASSCCAINGM